MKQTMYEIQYFNIMSFHETNNVRNTVTKSRSLYEYK